MIEGQLIGLSVIEKTLQYYCGGFLMIRVRFLFPAILAFAFVPAVWAQSGGTAPLTSKEVVALVYQLPKDPSKRDEIIEEIRKRGIGFPLTDGMRSLVATKSGNDALLRRTLEEAERRRVNPVGSTLPPESEANELLSRATTATLAAREAMPDFIVRQLIRRSVAYGTTNNWIPLDNLTIAVSYRATAGEEYKVLTVNGMPLAKDTGETKDYSDQVGGSTSAGEYVTGLASIFKPQSLTEFKPVDTDLLRGRRTLVYEFVVKLPNSELTLKADKQYEATVGSRGRVWIDRETNRVLRFEQIATEIPAGFPITAASSVIDYDWTTISEKSYLLPSHADIFITTVNRGQTMQSRNEIRFRGYQKFGAELKVVDEIDDSDAPADNPPPPPPTTKKP
jgi:hypothetical protein